MLREGITTVRFIAQERHEKTNDVVTEVFGITRV
jgi:hypothetical protein